MSVVNSVDALIHNCAKEDICGCEAGLEVVCNFSFTMSGEAFTVNRVTNSEIHFVKAFCVCVFQLLSALVSSDKCQMFSYCSVILGIPIMF